MRERDDAPDALAGVVPSRIEIFRPKTRDDSLVRRAMPENASRDPILRRDLHANDDLKVRGEVSRTTN